MRSRRLSLLAGFLVLFTAAPLAAQTTGFDDLGSGGTVPNGYIGLQWNNFYYLNATTYASGQSGYLAGMVSSPYVAYNAYADPAWFWSTNPFTFNDVYLTGAWNDNLNVDVYGYLGATQVYYQALTLSAVTPTHAIFNWTGIDKVYFASSGGTHHDGYNGSGAHFAMDNLTVNGQTVGVVPEPTSVLLLATGLIGIAVVLRRKRRNAVDFGDV